MIFLETIITKSGLPDFFDFFWILVILFIPYRFFSALLDQVENLKIVVYIFKVKELVVFSHIKTFQRFFKLFLNGKSRKMY